MLYCIRLRRLAPLLLYGALSLGAARGSVQAQPFDPALYAEMRWRCIGPFRGGRTVGAAGVPGQPNVFYIGVNNGGVWKTTDYGRMWTPIFDDQPTRLDRRARGRAVPIRTSSTSAAARGSSGPTCRSATASTSPPTAERPGSTWAFATASRSARSLVDPHDPNRVFVAVLGHPVRPERRARRLPLDRTAARPGRRCSTRTTNTGAIARRVRPGERADGLRRPVVGPPGAVGERRMERTRQRALQVRRRRHDVAALDPRAADVPAKGSAASASAIAPSRPKAALRGRRTRPRSGGHLPLRRRRRDAGAASTPSPRLWGRGATSPR